MQFKHLVKLLHLCISDICGMVMARQTGGPLQECLALESYLFQWLDDDCIGRHVRGIMQCRHPCGHQLRAHLLKCLMTLYRDDHMFSPLYLEDICWMLTSYYKGSKNVDDIDSYCPEIQGLRVHLEREFTPIERECQF